MDLQRFDKILKIRALLSAIIFAIFVALSLHASLTGWLSDNPTPSVIALLLAYFLWPRRALPKSWKPETDEDQQLLQERRPIESKLRKVQLFYFITAIFLLALIPFLLGEPVFRTT